MGSDLEDGTMWAALCGGALVPFMYAWVFFLAGSWPARKHRGGPRYQPATSGVQGRVLSVWDRLAHMARRVGTRAGSPVEPGGGSGDGPPARGPWGCLMSCLGAVLWWYSFGFCVVVCGFMPFALVAGGHIGAFAGWLLGMAACLPLVLVLDNWKAGRTRSGGVRSLIRDVCCGEGRLSAAARWSLVVSICVLLAMAMWGAAGLCFCIHPTQWSTAMTRWLAGVDVPCEPGVPCHLYFTLASEPSSIVAVFHSPQSYGSPRVCWLAAHGNAPPDAPGPEAHCMAATVSEIGGPSEAFHRYVYYAEVTGLVEDRYHVYAGDEGWWARRQLRPLASFGSHTAFTEGGDAGVSSVWRALLGLMARDSPAFFLLGGDIAYSNGGLNCYYRWDRLLRDYDELMVTPAGDSVPLAVSPGNHDVEDSKFRIMNRRYGKFFLTYFPYDGTSGPNARTVWHGHRVAPELTVLSLDSSHTVPFTDEAQMDFARRHLQSARESGARTVVMYHIPLQPSHHKSKKWFHSAETERVLTGLFDEFNVPVAFEHHFHMYKRTSPLRGGEVSPPGQGTVYAGDGSLGVWYEAKASDPQGQGRIVGAFPEAHYWRVTSTGDALKLEAVSSAGAVFDSVRIPLNHE